MAESIYVYKTFGETDFLYKLGYTSNFKSRDETYRNSNPLIETLLVMEHKSSRNIEKMFHEIYHATYKNEWYSFNPCGDVVKIIDTIGEEILDDFELNEKHLKLKLGNGTSKIVQLKSLSGRLNNIKIDSLGEYLKDSFDKVFKASRKSSDTLYLLSHIFDNFKSHDIKDSFKFNKLKLQESIEWSRPKLLKELKNLHDVGLLECVKIAENKYSQTMYYKITK